MMISKKALSRRTVLRGLGTAVALPLLDSMLPAWRQPRFASGSEQAKIPAVIVTRNSAAGIDHLLETADR